ncbi:DUF2235 domain-containing protein [Pseudomonas sp. MWU12-2037]|uniref:phospholipase effector Tle1 domain-containing protein n=1 Tax=Pseudomonas sp. MWU12-2037 TaxID=2928690 RepID=UPI00200BF542|nr:DUF2235 domain-containing protein [Pseudomonas sp. MWU12-2037]
MYVNNSPSACVLVVRILFAIFVVLAITACNSNSSTNSTPTPESQLAPASHIEEELVPTEGFSSCLMQTDDFALLRDIEQHRVIPDSGSSLQGGRQPLSILDMNEWNTAVARLEHQPVPLVIDTMDVRPVFVAVFDGTWNDRDDSDIPITVPGVLSRELEASQTATQGLQVKYYHGVGTRVSKLRHWWEGATGSGTRERAEQAFTDLQAFIQHEGKTPHVYAIGFSRGAASARHFLNLVEPLLQESSTDNFYNRGRSFALLFDTVATGQLDHLQLGIPSSTAYSIHFVATHERRLSFPVVLSLPAKSDAAPGQRIVEVQLPAAHSDLGGGYGNGLESLSLSMARHLLVLQGFVLVEQKVDQQAVLNMGRHNSDWPGTAVGNSLRRLGGAIGREHIEPKLSSAHDATENPIMAKLEELMREVSASKAELKRLEERYPDGPAIFEGLSIQLQQQGNGLVLTTNCPQHVAFDRRSHWLLLDGERYLKLAEHTLKGVEAGHGIILTIDRQNPKNFRPLVTQ